MANRVRAIIIEDEKILLIKRVKPQKTYWIFPGGGIENGEENKQALIRECKEELGVDVEVGKLFAQTVFYWDGQPEENFFYFCKIVGGEIGSGSGREYENDTYYEGTHEIEWVDIEKLEDIQLLPEEVKSKLLEV